MSSHNSQTAIADANPATALADMRQAQKECFTCRLIGTAALGGVGIYALRQSREHAPGSIVGKRMMAGVGVCFLIASALRWTK